MSVEKVSITEGYTFDITTGKFTVKVDVPETLGGKDQAPDPHRYLEVALAGCTAITVQMYAKRRNIPLEYTDVKIKILSEGAKNEILREVHFVGDLTEEQKTTLLSIAEKCPIHKLLSAGALITTKVI